VNAWRLTLRRSLQAIFFYAWRLKPVHQHALVYRHLIARSFQTAIHFWYADNGSMCAAPPELFAPSLFRSPAMNRDDRPTDVPQEKHSGPTAENSLVAPAPSNSVPLDAASTRNPWDDDDHPGSNVADDPDRALTMRLLRPSIISLAICTGVIFVTAAASSNAVANSPLEQTSLALHRLGMLGLLFSFFGILLAYRLPSISRSLRGNPSQAGENSSTEKRSISGLRSLLLINVALIVVFWLFAFSGLMPLLNLLQLASLVSVGVLCSIALLHRGYFQAYAVGVLVPLVIISLNWQSMLMQSFGAYGMISQQDRWMLSGTFAALLTGALVAGLISAAIYVLSAKAKELPLGARGTDDKH